jgi:hypothetical protein
MPQLSGITEFSAAYLFLILAIVFEVLAMVWHKGYFFLLSMAGWAFFGFYVFTVADGNATIIMFGTFCFLAAFTNILLMVALRPKKEPPQELKKLTSEEYTEMLRAMRYGKRSGYDKTGNKISGW